MLPDAATLSREWKVIDLLPASPADRLLVELEAAHSICRLALFAFVKSHSNDAPQNGVLISSCVEQCRTPLAKCGLRFGQTPAALPFCDTRNQRLTCGPHRAANLGRCETAAALKAMHKFDKKQHLILLIQHALKAKSMASFVSVGGPQTNPFRLLWGGIRLSPKEH